VQVPFEQQPLGQLAASHSQMPLTQAWFKPQAAPAPQRQTPDEQVLAATPSQAAQLAPAGAQDEMLSSVSQTDPLQQPLQEVASQKQRPCEQKDPWLHAAEPPHEHPPSKSQPSAVLPQVAQAAPRLPQSLAVGGVTQLAPTQQPLAQESAVHAQLPDTQAWPASHPGEQVETGPPEL
jgi:hypothetical protein